MEELSRVKKYEDLRKTIESDSDDDINPEIKSEQLSSFANKLNNIDPNNFKKMDIEQSITEHVPERDRRESYFKDNEEEPIPSFKNEYLDDFIKEVKEYNIANGNREQEDTQMNILNQLQNVTRVSRVDANLNRDLNKDTQYNTETDNTEADNTEADNNVINVEEESNEPIFRTNIDIAAQVKELAALEVDNDNEGYIPEENLSEEEQQIINNEHARGTGLFILPKQDDKVVSSSNYRMDERKIQQKLVEETQQLRVQISEYEDEMNGMSDHLEKNSKLLTTILLILIFALIAVIGFVVYMVIKSGGNL